jgi:hypothetical protein
MKDYFFTRQKISQERFKVQAESEHEAWIKLSEGDYEEVKPIVAPFVRSPVLIKVTKAGEENG